MTEHERPDGRGEETDRLMRYLIEQTGADLVVDHAENVPDSKLIHVGYYAEKDKVQATALEVVQNEGLRIIQAGTRQTTADPDAPHVEAVGRYRQDDDTIRGWFEAKLNRTSDEDGTNIPDDY